MKAKKTGKKILIAIGVIVLLTLLCLYWATYRITISAGTNINHLNDYRKYYFMTTFKPNTMPAPFGSSKQIIYFIPGQRKKMLEKIKADITDILVTTIENYSDIFEKYEMSDELKEILLYETPGGIGKYGFRKVQPETISRIESLIGLYHSVEKGGFVSQPTDFVFEIVEPDS